MIRAVLLICLLATPILAGQYEKLSPFTGVRFDGGSPEVEFEGEWYAPKTIDGRSVESILAFAKKRWPDKWKKRFAEDLVEVLGEMGHTTGRSVDLVLVHVTSGRRVTRKQAPMTKENRRRVWEGADRITRKAALADLAALRVLIEERFSYLGLREVDLDAAFAEAADGLPERVDRRDLSIRVRILLAKFGDGHTRVSDSLTRDLGPGFLPILVGHTSEGLVAFRDDRKGFVDEDRPFLVAIDGLDIEEWVNAASVIVANGSPQFRRRHSVRNLRYLGWLRKHMGRPASGTVHATLTAAKGKDPHEVSLPLAARKPIYGDWPRRKTARLDGNLGYLRIESMGDDPAFVEGLAKSMQGFAKTRGVVIDVRGNGGGTRDALRTIMPFLLGPKNSPAVVNMAKYRLPPDEAAGRKDGYLENRFLFPVTSDVWTSKDRSAIRRAAKAFKPGWMPDEKRFSDWHHMLIHRRKGPRFAPEVIVLMDSGCFSATDIFLAALKHVPGVRLLGTPSGGGSGRSRSYTLPSSGIRVRISSMASFHPIEGLYDGHGVKPHVLVPTRPGDLIGRTDTALAKARSLLR